MQKYVPTEALAWIEKNFAIINQMFDECSQLADGTGVLKKTKFQAFAIAIARLSGVGITNSCICDFLKDAQPKSRYQFGLWQIDPLDEEAGTMTIDPIETGLNLLK